MMPDKLDNKLKEILRNDEVPFDASAWNRLERELDSRAAGSKFKLEINWKYSLNTALILAGASALVWGIVALTNLGNSSTSETKTIPAEHKINLSEPIINNTKTASTSTQVPEENKEVVVQQFFPTQVYNIQYPVYGGGSYNTSQPIDQVATENGKDTEGEFSDVVKNRQVILNPMVRPYLLGESSALSPVSANNVPTNANSGGNPNMKLSPEELKLFSDPSLLNSKGQLIFGDQIDARKGFIYKSKEGDSVQKIYHFEQIDQPELDIEKLNNNTNEPPNSDTKSTDSEKPSKKSKRKKEEKKTEGNN